MKNFHGISLFAEHLLYQQLSDYPHLLTMPNEEQWVQLQEGAGMMRVTRKNGASPRLENIGVTIS